MAKKSSPEHRARIYHLFDRALELPESEWASFLDRECVDDPEAVRAGVERLLARSVDASPLATGGALPDLGRDPAPDTAPGAGRQIGPWRLVEEIGRGGMGVVYRAERADGQFEQRVALKLLGSSARGEAVARFERERQIVARLDDPGIARLLDGGVTEEGRPWFVMELVDGLPIDRYCDENRLPVARRIELVEEVGRAVAYAHRNLVVHRDLKPSNILVTAEGRVKLLDFGIAKPLQDDGIEETRTVARALTPEYASPEQFRGEPVTTASDVFQLGLLLFELLSGRRARDVDTSSPSALLESVRSETRERPSNAVTTAGPQAARAAASLRGTDVRGLVRSLRGDLDQIVLMALRPEANRRYPSAAELVADLARFRRGQPVSARPDTFAYRARKLWQRNRIAVAAALACVVLLAATTVVSTVQARRIAVERDRAEAARDRAEKVKAYALGLFSIADPERRAGPEVPVTELLDQGVERARTELADEPAVLLEVLTELGKIHANLSRYETAEALLREAVELRAALGEDTPGPSLPTLLEELGSVLVERDAPDAEELFERVLALREAQSGADAPETARALVLLARARLTRHAYAEAEELLRRAIEIHRRHLEPGDPQIADELGDLAHVVSRQDRPEEAVPLNLEALEIYRAAYGEIHPDLASGLNNLALNLWRLERWQEGDEAMDEAMELMARLYGEEHADIATSLGNWADSMVERGDLRTGAELHRRSLAMRREILGPRHVRVAQSMAQLGETLQAAGDPEAAEPLMFDALGIFRESLPPGHPSFGRVLRDVGTVLVDLDRPAEAEPYLREMMEIYRGRERPDLVALGSRALGACLWRQGRYEEAEALLEEGLTGVLDDPEERDPQLEALAELYDAWGRPDEAARVLQERRAAPAGSSAEPSG